MSLNGKARRAAEWLMQNGYSVCHTPKQGGLKAEYWTVRSKGMDVATPPKLTTDEMLQYAEDRGWQDTDAGNPVDGVEWYSPEEYAVLDNFELAVILTGDGFKWKAIPWEGSGMKMVSGTAPTRAEARRQAVEAARGMG